MHILLSLALFLALSGFATAQTTDAEKLNGTWEITALMDEGALVPDEVLRTRMILDARLTIQGSSISFITPGTFQTRTLLFGIDEKANPKTIDLGGTEKIGGKGIYSFTGETLMICVSEVGVNQRPADFSAKKNSPQILMTLKRIPASVPATQPPAAPAPLNDESARKLLIGTWGHQDEDWVTLFTLNEDGTFSSTRNYKDKFGKLFHENVRSSGTWKLENAVVVCTITTSTDKPLVNQIFSYRIQSLSATELLAIDQSGKWRREWKAP
jgi:uncharacterized protein (TIGR03067 family)